MLPTAIHCSRLVRFSSPFAGRWVERERLARNLIGMRTYLETVQDLVSALAENQVGRIPQIAAKSGVKLLGNVNPFTALKAPIGFTMMSLDTHDKFDKLAEKARRGASRTKVLALKTLS